MPVLADVYPFRRILNANARPDSPVELEDEEDDEIQELSFALAPELASIKRNAEAKVMRESTTPGPERSQSPEAATGPPVVNLKVCWKPHPKNPNAKPQAFGFKMRRVRYSLRVSNM